MTHHLLPEEDALDDQDDDDDADSTLPGDLWFRHWLPATLKTGERRNASGHVVYSGAFVPWPA